MPHQLFLLFQMFLCYLAPPIADDGLGSADQWRLGNGLATVCIVLIATAQLAASPHLTANTCQDLMNCDLPHLSPLTLSPSYILSLPLPPISEGQMGEGQAPHKVDCPLPAPSSLYAVHGMAYPMDQAFDTSCSDLPELIFPLLNEM